MKTGLIGTKYSKPGMNQYLITRRRLHQKLDESMACRVTTVTAPAGYGKTTAVLDWVGTCGFPTAWLSVDSHDNNPATFWRYVCSALDSISDGICKDAEYVFSSLELLRANTHLNMLIDRLSEVQSDFLLVLDDLHLIDDPSILEGLSYLIDYLPTRMHLIIISRMELKLNLAKHKIKWQIRQLEEKDLHFRYEEIFEFYQVRGFILENKEIEKVVTHTEGWAAALVALAMSMEHVKEGHEAIAALEWSGRDIGQYLEDEVIWTWQPEELGFAIKTSILETLNATLCDAVTGEANARQMLNGLYTGSGFLSVADEEKQEYKYHYLFKTFLYKLLTETRPEEIPNLHIRAAEWFLKHGDIPEAIEHLLDGGMYREAFEILEHHTDHLIHRNDFAVLFSWIERLPTEYKDNSFKIASIYALYYAEIRRYDLSRQWVDRMKTFMNDYQYASGSEWISYSRTVCTLVEANLLIRKGDVEYLSLLFSAAENSEDGSYKMPEYNDFNTADIYFYRCPIYKITNLFRQAPDQYGKMTERYRGMISKNPGYSPLGAGEFLYESNRLEDALPFLLKAVDEAQKANCPGALVPAMVDIARMKRSGGDILGAFSILEECEKQIQKRGKCHWVYLIRAFRCRLFLDIGDKGKVQEWLFSSKLSMFTELDRIREFELIVYVRVLISLNRTQDAQLLLQRLLIFMGDNDRPHSRVEVLNLLALLAFQNNHASLAFRYMDESFDIGINEGYVRSYLDELAPMAHILRAYMKSRRKQTGEAYIVDDRKQFAASLLKQMHGGLLQTLDANDVVAEEINEKIKEQLTAQERKVLELMVNAATNQEISDKLGISLRTVKTHTGNIYAKLGLKNRAQCIKLARELELI